MNWVFQTLPLVDQEFALGTRFVLVFGGLWVLDQQFGMAGLEGVGDVFQEDQPQGDMLVVARLHVASELVGGFEQLGLKTQLAAIPILPEILFHHGALSFAMQESSHSRFLPLFLPANGQ